MALDLSSYKPVPGVSGDATQIANGFQAIQDYINGLSLPTAAPPGFVGDYAGSSAPSGWLMCDGSAVSRTTYANLFTAIGTTYGAGDGSTTFNLPPASGRVIVGKGANADVNTLGASDGLPEANRSPRHNSTNGLTLPNHGHSVSDPQHSHGIQTASGAFGSASVGSDFNTGGSVFSTNAASTGIAVGNPTSNPAIGGSIGPGGSRPTDTPAFLVLNKIIKT